MRVFPFFSLLLFSGWAAAFDVSLHSAVKSSYVASRLTSTPFEAKLVHQARDEAASFVASDGALRSARLEAALQALRQRYPDLESVDDHSLALAMLAW